MSFKRLIRPGRGAADITPLLGDARAFRQVVEALAALFAGVSVERVACVEGRGFLLGAPVAYQLGAGVVPLRAEGRLRAAGPVLRAAYTDYTGASRVLAMHADALRPGDGVLIIDDWVQSAGTVRAAVSLIEQGGGRVAGIGALIDDTTPETRAALAPYRYRFLEQTAAGDRF